MLVSYVVHEKGACEKNTTLDSLSHDYAVFVAFVEDNATLSSMRYFENHGS